jgi:lipoate-protein ligase A
MATSALTCRLLPYAVADGAHNMALDEVLLEAAAAGSAALRFYGWSEATVSLGYFQPEKVRFADPRTSGLPFVRRPTGGAMLVHHHEVTYGLALPPSQAWQGGEPWLRRMHAIISAALSRLYVPAHLHAPAVTQPFAGVLCFQHCTPGDLLIGPAKVVGSAQRKQRGALLQHGSILLKGSQYTPVLPGIRELSGQRLTSESVVEAIIHEFTEQTGWMLARAAWTQLERQGSAELVASKYTQDRWNKKR